MEYRWDLDTESFFVNRKKVSLQEQVLNLKSSFDNEGEYLLKAISVIKFCRQLQAVKYRDSDSVYSFRIFSINKIKQFRLV